MRLDIVVGQGLNRTGEIYARISALTDGDRMRVVLSVGSVYVFLRAFMRLIGGRNGRRGWEE
jgi:hypothetical protein